MGLEIERRFLVDQNRLPRLRNGKVIKQTYFSETDPCFRIRIIDKEAFLTVKASVTAITRKEFEYKIPFREALELCNLSENGIEKIRYSLSLGKDKWTIDFFQKENSPLVLAEIELKKETENFNKPLWVANEVTQNPAFTSQSLAFKPFGKWEESGN